MTLKLSHRGKIPPFIAMDVLRDANRRAAQGDAVIHLELGQPSTPAPQGVLAAARAALSREVLGYTDALGLPALRGAIAGHYHHRYGVTLDPARVVVTTGSSAGFILAFLAAFDAGDRIAFVAPGYPAYRNIVEALDLVPVELPIDAATGYHATLDLIRGAGQGIDGLILASPANPTGTMLDQAELEAIARYCDQHGIRLISDEIYHGIAYTKKAATAAAASETAIIVNSFSKYYSMTGWRIGWMVAPTELVRPIECLAQNLYVSAPTLSQHAALAAFSCEDELDANVARYAANRTILLDAMTDAGFQHIAPADGAFYLYADIAQLSNDSEEFCRRMLAEIGVAGTPGVDFDRARGHRTIRFCFAGATAEIAEAAKRLAAWRK